MSAQPHLERFFASWMRHDASEMATYYAADAVMEDPTLAAPRRGRDAIERYYREMFATLEHPVHDLLDWATRADRVWFEWSFGSGGATKPLERYRGVSVQTLREGLIVHDAAYWTPDA